MLDFILETDPFETKEFAKSVRKFASAELNSDGFNRADFDKMAKLGLAGMSISDKNSGSDVGALSIASCIFETARSQLGPAIYLSVHCMVSKLVDQWSDKHSTELKELAEGKSLGAFCLTEAGAGSDAKSISTTAEKKSGNWILNGEKIYITSAGHADLYLVFAKTGSEEISAFLIRKDAKGLSFGPSEKKMGAEGSPIASVKFDNCEIPESSLVGKQGEGYKIALSGLNGGRINIAAAACGIASTAISLALEHAKDRKQFGKTISDFQGIQFMFADMMSSLRASVLLTREAAAGLERGEKENWPASIAKCFSTDSAMKITTDCVQILGGAGYLSDYKVEKLMRDAKMLQIVEGTNQIQRVIISRSLLEMGT